ncbi:MAG TPA: heterodisulfide reductase-related iron-sulfur binding cluster [Pyrinomonadaceae bacterium]|nr:heterodisulfide reductase-related iron-sulfur binding cluster [Pyrinomonadaceae bacterium]
MPALLQAEEQKLLACIHCGLCLEACPTYVATGDENDGPRGRLYLMRAVGEGRLATDSTAFERHIDRCLGCRACEQVCPAGVEYGQLLEAARGELFTSGKARGVSYGLLRLVLKHVWLHPARLKFAFTMSRIFRDAGLARLLLKTGIARLFSAKLEFGLALLTSSAPRLELNRHQSRRNSGIKNKAAAAGAGGDHTMLFTGCVGAGLFSRVNLATQRVLEANGFGVETPPQQGCCGALHAHAGDLEGARVLARRNIEAFSRAEFPIITNAGGCGAMLASYGHLLADDQAFAEPAAEFCTRVRDVSQQLETVEPLSPVGLSDRSKRPAPDNQPISEAGMRVTYDASCHLLYGQHAGEAPLKMVGSVPGITFGRLEGSERCCGGAGIYNLLEPNLSRTVLDEKLRNIQATGAEVLATGNPGCQMQIGAGAILAGMDLTVCHPVELLDESYARAGIYETGFSSEK